MVLVLQFELFTDTHVLSHMSTAGSLTRQEVGSSSAGESHQTGSEQLFNIPYSWIGEHLAIQCPITVQPPLRILGQRFLVCMRHSACATK